MEEVTTIIGGGLAGCEAAWQLAQRGLQVRLLEMKPRTQTPAQVSPHLAELVCSNSLRSANPHNAVGLLKEEMASLGSVTLEAAAETRVPAGDALAVDRDAFARAMTRAIREHPGIDCRCERVVKLPQAGETLVATGPLTDPDLATDIGLLCGPGRLYFYDAIAPIVAGDSIDRDIVYAASRYGKGEGSDYLNCPMTKEQYEAFVDALQSAECMPLHPFEKPKYFEGCMPIEETARRGRDTLRFGAMKPVGLRDPRTGESAYAVVQLRQEDRAGEAHNIVGFQTKMKYPEQRRVFAMVPGLGNARYLRLGAMHRNTFLDSPGLLDSRMRLKTHPFLRFAGQVTGVEGYVESAAHGLITAVLLASDLAGNPIEPPPPSCAVGALLGHVLGTTRLPGRPHEPQNINWSLFEPLKQRVRKRERKAVRLQRSREAFAAWARDSGMKLRSGGLVE